MTVMLLIVAIFAILVAAAIALPIAAGGLGLMAVVLSIFVAALWLIMLALGNVSRSETEPLSRDPH